MKKLLFFLGLVLCFVRPVNGQAWSGILSPTYGAGSCTYLPVGTYAACGVDWTLVGVPGGIPTGTQSGSTINSTGSDQTSQINTALSGCGGSAGNEKYVQLAAGTFQIAGNLTGKTYCYLTGMGADQTIMNWTVGGGTTTPFMTLGSGAFLAANAVNITSGATAGSTSIVVSSATGYATGQPIVISEYNNPAYVDTCGTNGCAAFNYCSFNWSGAGATRTRCQEDIITGVSGTTITLGVPLVASFTETAPNWAATTTYGEFAFITNGGHLYEQTANVAGGPLPSLVGHCTTAGSPPAFSTSGGSVSDNNCTWLDLGVGTTLVPQAITSNTGTFYAGIENLQIYNVNGPATADVQMSLCIYCWETGVEHNYTGGNYAQSNQGFRDEIRDNYYSNAYPHGPGAFDETVDLVEATSNTLVQNNIFERGHVGGVMLERGCTSNVVAYNFVVGPFDDTNGWNIESLDYHGAHCQFNLAEGNIWSQEFPDSVWGSASHGTGFRNWDQGRNVQCSPQGSTVTRTSVVCSPYGYPTQAGKNGWYSYQVAAGINIPYSAPYFNFIGIVVGDATAQALVNTANSAIAQNVQTIWHGGINVPYGSAFNGFFCGFANTSDSGSYPLDSAVPCTQTLLHGIYSNVDGSTTWQSPISHTLPASFYLPGKPAWWGTNPFPSTGPDVTGGTGPGGHTYDNPAANCYHNVMGGVDGSGSPLVFNAHTCYYTAVSAKTITSSGHLKFSGKNKLTP